MTTSKLDSHRLALIRLSAALAARNPQDLRLALDEGLRWGDPVAVEEVILQSYLFLGYPVSLNAFAMWREVSGRNPGEGIPDDWDSWRDRGEGVCRTVYGGQYEGLRRNIRGLHPDMERWMVTEGYGKVLARPGLDLANRELCIVALLAVLGTPKQLHSHLRGALNSGAQQWEVEEALAAAFRYLPEEDQGEYRALWEDVRDRAARGGNSNPPGTS